MKMDESLDEKLQKNPLVVLTKLHVPSINSHGVSAESNNTFLQRAKTSKHSPRSSEVYAGTLHLKKEESTEFKNGPGGGFKCRKKEEPVLNIYGSFHNSSSASDQIQRSVVDYADRKYDRKYSTACKR